MTEPMEPGATSVERVCRMLTITVDEAGEAVADVVAGVNALVTVWLSPDADGVWSPRHVHGATMLAARLYRRKDTPAGVLSFGLEGAAYVQRNDPDVALLLEMGAYTTPRVG